MSKKKHLLVVVSCGAVAWLWVVLLMFVSHWIIPWDIRSIQTAVVMWGLVLPGFIGAGVSFPYDPENHP